VEYKNKNWLIDKYISEKLSANEIGKLCGKTKLTIYNWLKKYNIPRRSIGEASHLKQTHYCNLSQEAIEWINGELLGDGCLQKTSKYSARFQYTSKHKKYIEYIRDTLKSFGIKQSGEIYKRHLTDRNMDCFTYQYHSLTYVELLSIRKQWYPNGKKIVPKDIELTPLVCRQWYIGDGFLKNKYKNPSIMLSTDNFTTSDVKYLVNKLFQIGINSQRQLSSNRIYIPIDSAKKFLKYIGNCPIECYKYKWG
jgi:hypothetical protein